MGWAQFWVIFSQTHLVTLVVYSKISEEAQIFALLLFPSVSEIYFF
jgi:hypothetical protein